MDQFEIIRTTWRRIGQSLAIEYRGEYGSQPQVLILDTKDILRLWLEKEAAEHQMHLTDGGLPASDSESKPAAIGR